MKKILYILPLALTALVSCQKEELFTGEGNIVTINAAIGKDLSHSRANTTDVAATSWSNGDKIAVNNENNAYVTYTYNGTSWTTAPGEFLKWSAETMTFNGYYPVTEGTSLTNFMLPTDQSDLAKISAADYMTTSESKQKPESGSNVDLNFKRKNARVIIKITKFNNEFVGTPVISNLTIKSAYANYTNGVIGGSPTTVKAYKANENSYIALVIPFNSTQVGDYINLDVTDNTGTKSLKLSTVYTTEPGKSYTHNLTVGKQKIEINNVTVGPWLEKGVLPDGDAQLDAGSVVIDNNVDGSLSTKIDDPNKVTSLSISGSLNYTDFTYIRQSLINLEILDLSQTTITAIPNDALNYYTAADQPGNLKLKRVLLPPTLKSIGNNAFQYCEALTLISLNGVETIGQNAFRNCSSLFSVDFGNSLQTVGNTIFYNCKSLRSIEFPASVRALGRWMFEDCSNLKTIKLNEGVETIPNNAFYGCGVESFEFPTSVRALGRWMFQECYNLKTIKLNEGVDSIPASGFFKCGIEAFDIPASVKKIGDYAFAFSPYLKNITIPQTVTSLGVYMFENCNLETASILAEVTKIPAYMFTGCSKLTTCTLNDKIEVIDERAFSSCNLLNEINIPSHLTTIGNNAFSNTALTSVTLPAGVSNIEEGAFYNNKISSLKINSTVDLTIGHRAFAHCSANGQMDIILPATLKKLSCTSFYGNNILRITCHAVTPPTIFTGDLGVDPNPENWTAYTGCYLKVPAASVAAYKAVPFWAGSFPGELLKAIE